MGDAHQRPGPTESALIAAQLGRPARGVVDVTAWCPHGYPAVVRTQPYLEDGTPFPTLYYLTCPSAGVRAGAWEAGGGVAELRRLVDEDATLGAGLVWLGGWYRERRRALADASGPTRVDGGAVLDAGIGGPATAGVATCLHAYAAALLAAEVEDPGVPEEHRPAVRDLLARYGELWCGDGACRRFAEAGDHERRAALDVGTNTVRLLVADVVGGRPVTIARHAVVTRLGQDLGANGVLHPDAVARTAHAIEGFVAEARRLGARNITLVGTSATRDAVDGRAFIDGLGHRLGICARVVPGEVEARLAYTGATLDISGEVVLMDVGGGSTELVLALPDGSLVARSLNVGSVRASERRVHTDPPAAAELASVRAEVRAAVDPLRQTFARGETVRRLVGVAGTVVTFACLALGLEEYRSEDVHLQTITQDQVATQIARLAALTDAQRLALPCMQPGRESVVCAGGEIVHTLMRALGYDELLVSERDLLDGIILAGSELSGGAPER
jgi:exopolyphosphatase / guanosine-5'-triphosphate,3'-diphosphate pyrophosphatase